MIRFEFFHKRDKIMSVDKFKEIINEEYFAIFKRMCSGEKAIASACVNAKSMDDVINLDGELVCRFRYYELETIITLWSKVQTYCRFNEIIDSLLQNHFIGINSYPSPTISCIYEHYVGDAALTCLKKGIEQSLITGDLKQKVEAGILANYKNRSMNKYTAPIEELIASDMIPWNKLEAKTIEELSLSKIQLGTCEADDKPKASSAFFKPNTVDKSIQTSAVKDEKPSRTCVIL